jgi:hypothetical protein
MIQFQETNLPQEETNQEETHQEGTQGPQRTGIVDLRNEGHEVRMNQED